ncbi:response regulator [Sphingomonas sp. S17]|jgi:two-component system response regulator FixJ|uniref:Response regulator transcription factor n=2 Tax=Sphingomonas paucimobilis TaxID=13689 RepID=A0A411LMW8_SPHPI|nr:MULTISPECIES: response regulator [Sphingomonas]EGI55724.1 response regulator [Sphingomonas sp. S17]MBQ1478572.1 response regulator transcription factor [Sphingomonas sp.]MCM3679581.1 response regulator [Sphingomonas paucimobilis]MDG5971025.1 response regulator [Sphingomonas paucimobilis]NNG59715.1 response regulator transcription factor [Sphingomonas paucimobilis]
MADTRLVHIIDDEEPVRRSMAFMLKTSGFAVSVWENGVAFLREAKATDAGCVLLDIRMPEMDGLEVQREMAAHGIAMPVIVLTGHGDIATAVLAMRQGAIDFLEKPFEKAALLAALDRGFGTLDRREVASTSAQEARVRIAALTPREQDILRGLVRGHPNKTIAFDLGISARTVEVHRAHVMTKLGVHSLSDALRLAFAAGMDAG